MHIDTDQLSFIDINLRKLLAFLESRTGLQFTITSLYRPGDTGVHGTIPLRGVDLRLRNGRIGDALADLVNLAWVYDPDRPEKKCAIYHDVGKGEHLHLQVHPKTVKKEREEEA